MELSSENLIALFGLLGIVGGLITWVLRFQDRNDAKIMQAKTELEKLVDTCQSEHRGVLNELRERIFQNTNWARDNFVPYKAFDDLRLEIRREFRDLKTAVGRIATRTDDEDEEAERVAGSGKGPPD